MIRRLAHGVVACFAVASLWAAPAEGQSSGDPQSRPEVRSEFWRDIAQPGYRRARSLLRQATVQTRLARRTQGPIRRARVENALDRLQRAARLAPEDPEILYWLGTATAMWERIGRDGQAERRTLAAINMFHRLRRLDPTYQSENVAAELGILHTRTMNYEAAQREYARAVAHALQPSLLGTTYYNYAEVTMLSEDLDAAVARYQRAIDISHDPRTRVLALFGQAVALDRLGEHRQAIEVTKQALLESDGSDDLLRDNDVFFEPAYELHWYEALVHEARADNEPEQRAQHLGEARRSWLRYLRGARGSSAPWLPIAEEHLERIEAALPDESTATGEGRQRPRWLTPPL